MSLKAKSLPLIINALKAQDASSSCSLAGELVEEDSVGPFMHLAVLVQFFPEVKVLDYSEIVYLASSLLPATSEEAYANILDCSYIGLAALKLALSKENGLIVRAPVYNRMIHFSKECPLLSEKVYKLVDQYVTTQTWDQPGQLPTSFSKVQLASYSFYAEIGTEPPGPLANLLSQATTVESVLSNTANSGYFFILTTLISSSMAWCFQVMVLVDTGATHNFIPQKFVDKLGLE
ncbi:hypothetical protein DSO57_1027234 [Entomophthora muscae]|uniref:Uncharacterized protein n=1 Tax=Entomophthora muscae TaxID=34485 RepID=A0ACC2S3T4_9FUNG|nr:hypothetical protein DSO57_1027234 [Entomophthora muscae]